MTPFARTLVTSLSCNMDCITAPDNDDAVYELTSGSQYEQAPANLGRRPA